MGQAMHGMLFVVGGAEDRQRGKLILRRFIDAAGGDAARIVIVATASKVPDELLAEYETAFRSLGADDLFPCHQRARADAESPDLLAALHDATGIFFTGGDQLKLVSTLGGTSFADLLHERFRAGMHIGGTSAGASALSLVMIARGRGRSQPRLSSVRLSPGLGVLRHVIVDQHFRERDRIGRLMATVVRNPSMLGFGIDENTAFIVDPNNRVEVLGKGALTIVDGRSLVGSNIAEATEHQPLAFAGMKVHVLTPGWEFDLTTRRIHIPGGATSPAESARVRVAMPDDGDER